MTAPDLVPAKLLYEVAEMVEAYPESYNQMVWVQDAAEESDVSWDQVALVELVQNPSCGTTACIAGWVVAIATAQGARLGLDPGRQAASILGLADDDARLLFDAAWKPRSDLTVPDALRAIADGATVDEVTAQWFHDAGAVTDEVTAQ